MQRKDSSFCLSRLLAGVIALTLLLSLFSPLAGGAVANAAPERQNTNVTAAQAPYSVQPRFSGSLFQSAEITPTDFAIGNDFGRSISLSSDGNTALFSAGSSTNPDGTTSLPVVYVYIKSNGNWVEQAKLSNNDLDGNYGYATSLSADGNTALVSDYLANNTGEVYVYTRSGSTWTQQAVLAVPNTTNACTCASFGIAVSVSADGNNAVIGAPNDTINGNDLIGAAYIFTRNGSTWSFSQKITASDASNNEGFGEAVAISQDASEIFVGAPYRSNGAGATYVFTKSNNTWSQSQELLITNSGTPNDPEQFGIAISLSDDGNTAVIGAFEHEIVGMIDNPGAAYVFNKNGNTWSETQQLLAPDPIPNDTFGFRLSISGDGSTILVGNQGHTVGNNIQQGAAYIFTKANGIWNSIQKLTAPDGSHQSYFSQAVALSNDGTTALIGGGIPYQKSGIGAVYVFTPSTTLCQPGTGSNPTVPTTTNYTYNLPFLACDSNDYTTYLAFQNISSTPATVTLQYFDPTGKTIATPSATCATLAAYAQCIASNPFADGTQGTGIIYSTQPLNVIVSEATPYGGSAYPVSAVTSNNLIVPVVIHGGLDDFSTQLNIFNGNNKTVTGTVQFYQQDGTLVAAASKSFSLTAYTSVNYNQVNDSSLGNNFYGWAQISSPSGSALNAQVLEQSPSRRFVSLANAQTFSQTNSYTLYDPAIFRDAYGSFNTGFNIVNPNSQSVTVSISYYNQDGTVYKAPAFNLSAASLIGIYQGNNSGTGLPANGLPDKFAGAAIITATGTVLMVTNEAGGQTVSGSSESGTYSAANQSSKTVGLPIVANGGYGFTTGATVFNVSSQNISGTIQYYNPDGTTQGAAQNFKAGPYQSVPVYQGDSGQGLPSNFYGTAIVTETDGGNNLIVTTNALSNSIFFSYTE